MNTEHRIFCLLRWLAYQVRASAPPSPGRQHARLVHYGKRP